MGEGSTEMATILVVDDEVEIADLVEIYLQNDGFNVIKAYDGVEALKCLKEHPEIMVIILDIMMPNMDGMEVCRQIRRNSNIPIIMLSAKASDMDKIMGFGTGVDDYVTKPFNPLELTARVKSQLKRYQNLPLTGQMDDAVTIGSLVIDKSAHRVTRDGIEIALTPIEFEILWLLVSHPGKVYSTDEIFEQVWKEQVYEVNNTVMVHIRRLREKIELDSKKPAIIKTVWGVGYKVEA
jgi:DNA-binding response OmpR family regulator